MNKNTLFVGSGVCFGMGLLCKFFGSPADAWGAIAAGLLWFGLAQEN